MVCNHRAAVGGEDQPEVGIVGMASGNHVGRQPALLLPALALVPARVSVLVDPFGASPHFAVELPGEAAHCVHVVVSEARENDDVLPKASKRLSCISPPSFGLGERLQPADNQTTPR